MWLSFAVCVSLVVSIWNSNFFFFFFEVHERLQALLYRQLCRALVPFRPSYLCAKLQSGLPDGCVTPTITIPAVTTTLIIIPVTSTRHMPREQLSPALLSGPRSVLEGLALSSRVQINCTGQTLWLAGPLYRYQKQTANPCQEQWHYWLSWAILSAPLLSLPPASPHPLPQLEDCRRTACWGQGCQRHPIFAK